MSMKLNVNTETWMVRVLPAHSDLQRKHYNDASRKGIKTLLRAYAFETAQL